MSDVLFKMSCDPLLAAIARSLADPIFVIDDEGRYLGVLGGASREHYDSGDYLIGRTLSEVLPAGTAERFLGVVRQAIAENRVQTLEFALSSLECEGNQRDGPEEEQWFEGRVSPILDSELARPCVAWMVVNITRRKELEAELMRLATQDELTGVCTRRVFLQRADAEIERAHRYGHSLQLAILDLDLFKDINDTLGHPAGDEVLRHVSALLRARVRQHDVLGRIGGEEFAICMPCTEASGARRLLEDILARLRADPPLVHPREGGERLQPVTFSAGLAELRAADRNTIDLFIRADAELYRAKHNGRNQIQGPGESERPVVQAAPRPG